MTQPAPLTEQQLDEITARINATRSGPWTLSDDLEGDGYPGHLWVVRTPDSGLDEPDDQAVVISIGDRALGEFIAHAREEVPALLAEVRRLRFRIAELGEQGPGDRETVAEAAQMYRSLRAAIERTMVDSDRWDGDEDESFHLARYVEWLAAERTRHDAEVMRRCAAFVRDTYDGEWADDAAATLERDADITEHGCPGYEDAGRGDTEAERQLANCKHCGRPRAVCAAAPEPAPVEGETDGTTVARAGDSGVDASGTVGGGR